MNSTFIFKQYISKEESHLQYDDDVYRRVCHTQIHAAIFEV